MSPVPSKDAGNRLSLGTIQYSRIPRPTQGARGLSGFALARQCSLANTTIFIPWTNEKLEGMDFAVPKLIMPSAPITREVLLMSLKNVLLIACCVLLPVLASAENGTLSIENIRDTKLLSIQNQIFELQKSGEAQQVEAAALRKEFAELQNTVTTHDRDILRVLEGLNTTNSNALELSDNVGNDIALIKKKQETQQKDIEAALSSLIGQQKELQKKIADLNTATNQRFKKTAQTFSTATSTQTSTVEKMHTEIAALKKALAAEQKQVQELETVINSQQKKTLNHLSSLENLNATISGLQQRSQSELQNIHQSLTQVIKYGLLTIIGVTLLSLIIFLIIRRKSNPAERDDTQTAKIPSPVNEEDDEILDWLKQKDHKE